MMFVLTAISATQVRAQIPILVDGAACTLAQAIGLANYANGIDPTSIGSATTSFGTCNAAGFVTPPPGPYELFVTQTQITLSSIDNYWYGPNALPPIASTIAIIGVGTGGYTQIVASHVGDPTPATADAFRFFYVSGGLEIPAGSLTLLRVILQGGYAKGGDSGYGGGGAGMGGAIFNQGSLALANVSLIVNTAQGGISSTTSSGGMGGGGMGQDAVVGAGGGFGGALGSSFGGAGSAGGSGGGGGGGGGFVSGSSGGVASLNGAPGGGMGGLGGAGGNSFGIYGGAAGDGGGGGGGGSGYSIGGDGKSFGMGGGNGGDGGGGGGIGGGGGGVGFTAGGGGGFGGGGGDNLGVFSQVSGGGFGGGAGGNDGVGSQPGGFGGGGAGRNSGGAGMGGAIFNHRGTVQLLNVTASANAARGGSGYVGCCHGSGLGAVLFNLNGSVTIDFSTLAGNFVSGTNGLADAFGPEDATVYSLAYGNKIEDGSASSATLTIHSSIIHGTNEGTADDVVANVVNGNQTNASSVAYLGKNFVQYTYTAGGASRSGILPSTADPLLGALSLYRSSPILLPVLPIGMNSPANNTATSCLEADNTTTLTADERGAARPYGAQCDIGAYEFDGDYIFADGLEGKL